MSSLIEIDGSVLEGGGQIIRTAIALSAVVGKPCRISKIRHRRPKPGLMPQHLTGIEATARLCNADVKGMEIGSEEVEFYPKEIQGGHYVIDIRTAGSISLVLQTLVLPSLHAKKPVELNIIGGTDVKWSPTMAFFEVVFCGNLKKMDIEIQSNVLKTGYYPKGGGEVRVKILSCKKIKPINWTEQGETKRIDCWSFASKYLEPQGVAERQMKGFKSVFKKLDRRDVQYMETRSRGSSITAHMHCNTIIGASALGERGKKAEAVGRECAGLLKKQADSKACLDKWMGDQILPYLALASGDSEVTVAEITNHCLTNIWVIEKFLPVKFEVIGEKGTPGRILVKNHNTKT